ncbi:hypothetical protein Cs7R123_07760 [Catellatospora sp. TT07R-123]|uniref:hypothetical protein n=1 Tax=Catellatospora sp. TT07R-123 TaxID=2733863 RepID=UPI001B2D8CD2|nr:hypothetical protein [Catellatospora sp. TT07R-123]GHJ43434.1 hypothetical protein Cs7R123_07760 [Catellatospora sp. TT07R-123]
MTAPAPEDTPPQTPPPGPAAELSRQLVLLLANVTVITALLVYFGWQRAESQSEALGLDQALFGMSTQDYALRSVGPVLSLLAVVGAAGLLYLWLDRWLTARTAGAGRSRAPRYVLLAAIAVPAVVCLAVPATDGLPVTSPLFGVAYTLWPLAVGAGILLLLYSARLRARDRGEQPPPLPTVAQLCVLLLLGVCLFTATSNHAEASGWQLAAQFVDDLPNRVSVVVTSDKPLHLSGPGLREQQLDDGIYQYSGLKLMDRFNGQVFLVPTGFRPGSGRLIVLAEGDGLRMSYGRWPQDQPDNTAGSSSNG